MIKMDIKKIFPGFVFVCFLLCFSVSKVEAASLKFEPTSLNANLGKNFDIKVNVEAGSEQITSVDVFVTYDSSLMEVTSSSNIVSGNFFQDIASVVNQPGKLYIAGLIRDPGGYRTGSGTLATISFKPKTTGSNTLTFDCTAGSTSDSNIVKNDTNSSDIINCADNNTTVVTIGGAISGTVTTPGTSSPTPTRNTTYTATNSGQYISGATNSSGQYIGENGELLQSGTLENVMKYGIPGGIMLFIGGLLLFL